MKMNFQDFVFTGTVEEIEQVLDFIINKKVPFISIDSKQMTIDDLEFLSKT